MTGRDRLRQAMTDGADELGVMICYEGIYTRDHLEQLSRFPWWAWFAPDMQTRQACYRAFVENHDLDCLALRDGPDAVEQCHLRLDVGGECPMLIDTRTGECHPLTRPAVGGTAAPPAVDHAIDRDGFDTMLGPDPAPREAFAGRRSGAWDFSDWQRRTFADRYLIGDVVSPLWQLAQFFGFERAMTMPLEEPELARYALRRLLRRQIARLPAIAARQADGVWIEECYTDMYSPHLFKTFNLPLLEELVAAIHEHGLQAIYYYCGNPVDRWHLLKASGADGIHVEESKKGFRIDIAAASEALGAGVCLFGNLDAISLLEHGTGEDIRREVARQLNVGRRRGGRFVLSIGSPVTPGTDVERVRNYIALARRYGR